MRQKGKLRSWNDDRGFGFITPEAGGKDVFLHISALSRRGRRPAVGQVVSYDLTTDERGRPRANHASLPGDRARPIHLTKARAGSVFVAIAFFCGLFVYVHAGKLPVPVLWAYIGLSGITFLVYASDKVAARDGAWRTSEGKLHGLSLLGGWPGALLAQQFLRHKSKKSSFRAVFFLTVVLNLGFLIGAGTENGREFLRPWLDFSGLNSFSTGRVTIEWSDK